MHETSMIMVGIFEVAVTPELRALFERTHNQMSGLTPSSPQYPFDEQDEMRYACEVSLASNKRELDMEMTEANLLELIHFLAEAGVRIPDIHPEIRTFSKKTRALSMHLWCPRHRLRKEQPASAPAKVITEPLFRAPVPA